MGLASRSTTPFLKGPQSSERYPEYHDMGLDTSALEGPWASSWSVLSEGCSKRTTTVDLSHLWRSWEFEALDALF